MPKAAKTKATQQTLPFTASKRTSSANAASKSAKPSIRRRHSVDLTAPSSDGVEIIESDTSTVVENLKRVKKVASPARAVAVVKYKEVAVDDGLVSLNPKDTLWKEIAQATKERRGDAPLLHCEDQDVFQDILRVFDASYEYGPCVGVSRLERWERAQALGLTPPVEVRDILVLPMPAVVFLLCIAFCIVVCTFHQQPTPPSSSQDFIPVNVGEEGVSVSHLQLTARVRSRPEPMSQNRRARYTSMTCLVCRVLVYRVHQVIPLDTDGRDGPLLPTDDWVEQDLLKSSTGWIEVHRQCLSGDAVVRVESSPQYSPLFSVTVHLDPTPPPSPHPEPAEDVPKISHLQHLSPVFLPPPFTPSNPAFAHLSSIATTESNAWRSALEDEIAAFIRAKTQQLLHSEALLRRQVNSIYNRFRDGMQAIEQADATAALTSPRSPATPSSPTAASPSAAADYGFVPLPVASARHEPPPSVGMSALSASLVSSGMHHPRAREPRSPSPTLHGSMRSASPTLTVDSGGNARHEDYMGANIQDIPRRMDPTLNTIASFHVLRLEEEMVRKRAAEEAARQGAAPAQQTEAAAGPSTAVAGSSSGPGTVNGSGNKGKEKAKDSRNGDDAHGKGKKRVTFQSQPAVVTIGSEAKKTNSGDEMVFDLDTDLTATDSPEGTVMTLTEGPPQPRPSQPRRTSGGRKGSRDSAGLPQSFASLRPASLPLLSHIRPRRSPLRPLNDLPDAPEENDDAGGGDGVGENDFDDEHDYDSRDAEILKLVAAHHPSHRRAWKKDGAEWRAFVMRNGRPGNDALEQDQEQDPPSPLAGIPSSMPIAIRPTGRRPAPLTAASYRGDPVVRTGRPSVLEFQTPETESGDSAPADNNNINTNSNSTALASQSVRNSMYADRDLRRALDPGALDFAVDNGEVPEAEDEDEDVPGELGRGGDRALRILQKRNELPPSGMFYSLAS
ncbi:SET domain-containing protein [Mycena kentingensis (nom. inval.)]|nr:SET domain-containing protein [Mycena kentingensis (nom. inval.)]